MKILYHDDPDGWCAAAVAWRALDGIPELIPASYDLMFSPSEVSPGEAMYMLDYSLQPFSRMLQLNKRCSDFIWIDHHKTAIEAQTRSQVSLKGIQEDGSAGCELTWRWFMPDHPVPKVVRWIGRYDVWDHDNCPEALPFQYGLKVHTESRNPASVFWDDIFTAECARKVLEDGKLIQAYQENMNSLITDRCAFETTFEGVPCVACVTPHCNSTLFDNVWDPHKHHMMIGFYWASSGKWVISLYTTRDDVDCSALASRLGGGGHKKAAGFQCAKLPFSLRGAV